MSQRNVSATSSPDKGVSSTTQQQSQHPIARLVQSKLQQGMRPYDIRLMLKEEYEVPSEWIDKYLSETTIYRQD